MSRQLAELTEEDLAAGVVESVLWQIVDTLTESRVVCYQSLGRFLVREAW